MDVSILYEYDELLIGNRKSLSPDFFDYGAVTNEAVALKIIKYAFETYLRWDPIDIRDQMNHEILKTFKLDGLLKYIQFPEELDRKNDLFYLAWCLYPWTVNYTYEERVYRVYQNVLDGTFSRFPKEYFAGTEGVMRAILCFRYMLDHVYHFSSMDEMYRFFGAHKSVEAIQKAKLAVVCRDFFGSSLDFLHESLPESQKNTILYTRERFRKEYARIKKALKSGKEING